MEEEQAKLTIETAGPVRIVRLNRPDALNAADAELHRRLTFVWSELEADPGCRAVVLTGNGRAFCAGGDLSLLEDMAADDDVRWSTLKEAEQLVRAMVAFPMPVVAAVNGPAVGLGCSLTALSDIVLIEQSAYLSDPHVSVGLVAADGGALLWPLLTSVLRAKEYLFLGEKLTAEPAVQFGFANRVVPDGESVDQALDLATRLAAKPSYALRATKKALNKTIERAMSDVLDYAITAEGVSSATSEHRTIVAAMKARSG